MSGYADTGLLASLYIQESTSRAAEELVYVRQQPLSLVPLGLLELRNTLNLAVVRNRLLPEERDQAWRRFRDHVAEGLYKFPDVDSAELYRVAQELSDRYTARYATRSLDLLHVSAAILLEAEVFLSFDRRQRMVAAEEGMTVLPA